VNSAGPVLGLGRLLADPGAAATQNERTATFTPGAVLEGRVLGQQGASTLVRVAGQTLAFNLPGGWAAGTRLSLQYLGSGTDGLRFLLRTAASGLEPEQVRLSAGGRSLQSYLAEAPGQLRSPTPLLPRPQTNPLPIVAALQRGLQQTGLFYESHLLAWSQGRWSQTDLLQEPQGQLSSLLRREIPAKPSTGIGAAATAAESPATQVRAQTRVEPTVLAAAAGRDAAASGSDPRSGSPVREPASGDAALAAKAPSAGPEQAVQRLASDTYRQVAVLGTTASDTSTAQNLTTASHLGPLLGQQLQTLAQQQLQWTGALWPGQWLEWSLRRSADEAAREGDGGGTQAEAEGTRWDSTLRLQLPHLGAVEARLRLQGQRLWLDLDGDRVATLQAAYAELHQALQALGLEVLRP